MVSNRVQLVCVALCKLHVFCSSASTTQLCEHHAALCTCFSPQRHVVCAGGGVLVHCQAGISRSATIVIAYCMWKERLSADAATALVSAARSAIWPNMGFKTQLREFERLGWDASKWEGWNMNKFLSTRYGDDSVDFMATMLGGTPTDRVSMRQQWQQQQQYAADSSAASLSASPFACSRACIGDAAACAGESSDSNMPVRAQNASTSCSSSDSRTGGQRHCSRNKPSNPSAAHTSGAGQSGSCAASCGGCCRATGASATRRMSLACYCAAAGCSAGSSLQGSSGGSNRLRRHSTGQHALVAAAAAAGITAVQLGSFQHLPFTSSSRLPEEAALLMAG
jgi:hypothetical protein